MSGKLYLASYRARFLNQERICRYRISAWQDVMKEVVIDRGMLIGSQNYQDMSGLERAEALDKIDSSISLCHDNIHRLRKIRDTVIPVKRFYTSRCARIRSKVIEMADEDLGKLEDSE